MSKHTYHFILYVLSSTFIQFINSHNLFEYVHCIIKYIIFFVFAEPRGPTMELGPQLPPKTVGTIHPEAEVDLH